MLRAGLVASVVLVAMCGEAGTDPVPPVTTATSATTAPIELRTTHHRLDGNRYAAGRGAVPAGTPVDVELGGTPAWIVGVPSDGGAVWVVALEDGSLEAHTARGVVPLDVAALPPGTPPAAYAAGDEVVVVAPSPGESTFTNPVLTPDGTRIAISDRGTLAGYEGLVPVDARLLLDDEQRLLVAVEPTDAYPHGVLGDFVEPSATLVVDGDAQRRWPAPDRTVIEGLAPIWADLDGDGEREIVVTVSNRDVGARIVVVDGASGPPIGRGNRWRHQIAVAPLGAGGELELVAVRTPHIGGVVEFYRLAGGELEIVAELGGYTSHVIGTRNLDLALAADADGDGQVELVVPTQERTELAGVARTAGGAAEAWRVPLPGRITTNVAAVELPGGRLDLAVGTAEGVLRIWPAD